MIVLTADIGNTNTAFVLYKGSSPAGMLRLKSDISRSVLDYRGDILAFLNSHHISGSQVEGAILSSVVPECTSLIVSALQRALDKAPVVLSHEIDMGIKICYDNPVQAGLDRLVNAAGAYAKYRTSVIVVDMGTATTFDFVSDRGEFMGGAISPGLKISAEALFEKASMLPRVDFEAPDRVVCSDTVSNIQSGIIFGYAGLVDGMVNRIIDETGQQSQVIATGGLSSLVFPYCKTLQVLDEYLTHDGLKIIFERQMNGIS